MKRRQTTCLLLFAALAATAAAADTGSGPGFRWKTVIHNDDLMPPLEARNFNSYNQPSVNRRGVVVVRARSRGGPPLGPATHGIYLRDMSVPGGPIVRILDRSMRVPQPNNLDTLFVETPSFPRIDSASDTIATRANHQPGWRYLLDDGTETRAGTTGIYANPFGDLVTGAAKLGHVPGFSFYGVPEFGGVQFEVFPGAPAITGGNTIVFKGNYTVDGTSRTGLYFRILDDAPSGGDAPSIMIANNTDTLIPGTTTVFGSTAPPSAENGHVVFAGFDDEAAPTLGGIYLAPLEFQPPLTRLVGIGEAVPGTAAETFTGLGEGMSFDGRFVGFWGAWGDETRTIRLHCPMEGNKDRIAYCNKQLVCRDTGEVLGDPETICDDSDDPLYGSACYVEREVPSQQGIFVHDTRRAETERIAGSGDGFEDFLYWNYSGKTPCAGSGHSEEGGEDDGESVRWRSSAFLAVSGRGGVTYNVVFKARSGGALDGLYLKKGPGNTAIQTVADTTMPGRILDPAAPESSRILALGIEREGLRGRWLAINATMGIDGGEEEDGMAGIYVTQVH